jgi:hypothetical protein
MNCAAPLQPFDPLDDEDDSTPPIHEMREASASSVVVAWIVGAVVVAVVVGVAAMAARAVRSFVPDLRRRARIRRDRLARQGGRALRRLPLPAVEPSRQAQGRGRPEASVARDGKDRQ